uniref:Epimerase domain-containing protein n=1 Tax=Macrostomum lignano TaxID=282301 RepID=A0A1I8FCX5_9PLAT
CAPTRRPCSTSHTQGRRTPAWPAGSAPSIEAAVFEGAAKSTEAAAAATGDTRRIAVALGVALGRDGGALASMAWPFRLGIGGPTGSGRQPVAWVHISDAVGVLEHACWPTCRLRRRHSIRLCDVRLADDACRCRPVDVRRRAGRPFSLTVRSFRPGALWRPAISFDSLTCARLCEILRRTAQAVLIGLTAVLACLLAPGAAADEATPADGPLGWAEAAAYSAASKRPAESVSAEVQEPVRLAAAASNRWQPQILKRAEQQNFSKACRERAALQLEGTPLMDQLRQICSASWAERQAGGWRRTAA